MPIALLTPVALKIVVDNVIGSQPLQGFIAAVLPEPVTQSSGALLVTAIGMLVLLTLIQQAEGFASWILQLYTGERMVLDFRTRLFRHAQRLSLHYHDQPGGDPTHQPAFISKMVVVDDDVFVGPLVAVLKGVHIGRGAFIEPGAVVTRDVPPGARVLGNPATVIEQG